MKLRTLLSYIEEAVRGGDLSSASPVFAVIRNEAAKIDSPEAWSAVSIVDVEANADNEAIDLIADESDDAKDISIEMLRKQVARFPKGSKEYDLSVGLLVGPDREHSVRVDAPVVEAYGDQEGLGLMSWFEGYEAWSESQG